VERNICFELAMIYRTDRIPHRSY